MQNPPFIDRYQGLREKASSWWAEWLREHPTSSAADKVRFVVYILFCMGYVALIVATALTPPPASVTQEPSASGDSSSFGFRVFGWAVAALLTIFLVRPLLKGQSQRYWFVFRRIRPVTVVSNIVVIAATIGLAYGLYTLFPFLDRSWLYLIPGSDGASNIGVLPARIPYVGALYIGLFALNVPMFAAAEERQYRRGTKDWKQGAVRSLRFGLAHWIMGIPLYAAFALTLPGLWYTLIYFREGEDGATTYHATYNLILCLLLAVIAVLASL